ncbi:MAG: NifB/NifX family molybdenum-iron cluster-binding protein [Deltaproteobacteria bacterium]|nr:NifB/NifX family molybdenum-iron cluster-binding protein [Deltaproteobacteria bacterium]
MKLAITSTGNEIDSNLDPRFGRAAYFIIVDPETLAFEVVENSQNLNLSQGAGIQAGKTIVDHQVDVLVTGHCGPKAFKVLQQAGVKVVTGAGGTVTDAIEKFNNGELEISAEADVEGHWV